MKDIKLCKMYELRDEEKPLVIPGNINILLFQTGQIVLIHGDNNCKLVAETLAVQSTGEDIIHNGTHWICLGEGAVIENKLDY